MVFAVAGGLLIAFEAFVLARWITGPRFTRVNSGPDSPPEWMKIVLNTWQFVGIFVALFLLYRFVFQPWRRDQGVSTDGLFCLGFLVLSFQDPLSNYFGHWFTYNSYLINWGSYVNDIPGWNSFGEPGAMLASPVVFLTPAYVYVCFSLMRAGCAIMRRAGRQWPRLGPVGLMSVCFGGLLPVCAFAESVVWLPLGFYSYAGGPGSLNSSHYYKFPLVEMFLFAGIVTSISAVRYFTNDRGETVVERGVDQLPMSRGSKTVVRFLAITAAVNLCMFVTYNLPASWFGTHSSEWPQDHQNRSYLTNHLCGPGTDRACPGPEVPIPRPHSPYLDPNGNLVSPGSSHVD